MKLAYFLPALALVVGMQAHAQVQVSGSQSSSIATDENAVAQSSESTAMDEQESLFPHPHPHHPPFHGGHPGWHGGGPRPGWHHGWGWDSHRHPFWWHVGIAFPVFVWAPGVQGGWWQCTAFNQGNEAFSAAAPDRDEAAYDALYDCGGPDYETQCYVPEGYCQRR